VIAARENAAVLLLRGTMLHWPGRYRRDQESTGGFIPSPGPFRQGRTLYGDALPSANDRRACTKPSSASHPCMIRRRPVRAAALYNPRIATCTMRPSEAVPGSIMTDRIAVTAPTPRRIQIGIARCSNPTDRSRHQPDPEPLPPRHPG
jgi:hypothetical protein